MKVTTKIEISFDTKDIDMDTQDWTDEELESYFVDTFVEDIHTWISNNEIREAVTYIKEESK